jgi:8-oxo-dGTP diphosphatase
MNRDAKPAPAAAVGVICVRDGEVLLVRRGTQPRLGEWSLPGGRIEYGEKAIDAAKRELMEETGVTAKIHGVLDVVDGLFPEIDRHYVLIDYLATWVSGEPRPGDDAAEARFFRVEDAIALVPWDETARVIRLAAEHAPLQR